MGDKIVLPRSFLAHTEGSWFFIVAKWLTNLNVDYSKSPLIDRPMCHLLMEDMYQDYNYWALWRVSTYESHSYQYPPHLLFHKKEGLLIRLATSHFTWLSMDLSLSILLFLCVWVFLGPNPLDYKINYCIHRILLVIKSIITISFITLEYILNTFNGLDI